MVLVYLGDVLIWRLYVIPSGEIVNGAYEHKVLCNILQEVIDSSSHYSGVIVVQAVVHGLKAIFAGVAPAGDIVDVYLSAPAIIVAPNTQPFLNQIMQKL